MTREVFDMVSVGFSNVASRVIIIRLVQYKYIRYIYITLKSRLVL